MPDTLKQVACQKIDAQLLACGWAKHWPSRIVRSQIEIKVKPTAGAYKITQPQVAGMVIPIPPLAEQTRTVMEVDRWLRVVEGLESVVSANLQRAVCLRQCILQKAFTGNFLA